MPTNPPNGEHDDGFSEHFTGRDYAAAGAFALDAYQAGALPGTGRDHRANPTSATELLTALLHDLMHYADGFGANFQQAAAEALRDYVNVRLDEIAFRTGTLVQITDRAAAEPDLHDLPRRGVVTDIEVGPGLPIHYEVRAPGEPYGYTIPADALEPGPPFRPLHTH